MQNLVRLCAPVMRVNASPMAVRVNFRPDMLKNSPLLANTVENVISPAVVENETMILAGYRREERLKIWRSIKGKEGLTKKEVGKQFWDRYHERQLSHKRKKGRFI